MILHPQGRIKPGLSNRAILATYVFLDQKAPDYTFLQIVADTPKIIVQQESLRETCIYRIFRDDNVVLIGKWSPGKGNQFLGTCDLALFTEEIERQLKSNNNSIVWHIACKLWSYIEEFGQTMQVKNRKYVVDFIG